MKLSVQLPRPYPVAQSARLEEGLLGPARFAFTWEPDGRDDVPVTVRADVEFISDRYMVRRVAVTATGDGDVTGDLLRRIPIQGLLRRAVLLAVQKVRAEPGFTTVSPLVDIDPAVAAQGPTDEALEAVAVIYGLALAVGDPPTQSVADTLKLTRSTAGRWVAKARTQGRLGETRQGKAGV